MNFFDVLTLIGGLCLFLFGMNVLGQALERRAGNSLKLLLSKLTNSKFKGFLTGMGVTAVIQSSSATTVMVVGFVNSKIMTLKQSIGVIMGANIGTTITAWILSLSGISGENVFLKMLKPSSFTPILSLIGIGYLMFAKSDKKKDTGTILLGFATLMFGMETMSGAVGGLKSIPAFQELFVMFRNPILGVLVGAVLTAIIQSSSASVGILQALSITGKVSYGAAVPILMGQNIGTCVTAMLSSIGTSKNAKRAAYIHLLFNVIGTVVWLSAFSLISWLVPMPVLDESASYLGIAIVNTGYKMLCAALLLPMSNLLEKLSYKILPLTPDEEEDNKVTLDERLLATPSIALEQCNIMVAEMARKAVEGFKLGLSSFDNYTDDIAKNVRKIEKETDKYEDVLGTYLAKLSRHQISAQDSVLVSKLLKAIGDFERISDHAVNIVESVEELKQKKIDFSDLAKKEMGVLCSAISEILDLTYDAFVNNDVELAYNVEPLEQVIDELKTLLRDSHIVRLQKGDCTVEAGFIWSDLLTNMERTSDHCSNIAVCIVDANKNNMNIHESVRKIKKDNDAFFAKYSDYCEKYKLDL